MNTNLKESIILHHLVCAYTENGLQIVAASKEIPPDILKLAAPYCMPSEQACQLPEPISPAYGYIPFGDPEQHFMLFCIKPSKRTPDEQGVFLFGHGRIGNKKSLKQLVSDPLALLNQDQLFICNDEPYLKGVQTDKIQLDFYPEELLTAADEIKQLLASGYDKKIAVQLLAAILMKKRLVIINTSKQDTQALLILYRLLPESLRTHQGIVSTLLMQSHQNLALAAYPSTRLSATSQVAEHIHIVTLKQLPSTTKGHLINLANNLIDWALQENDTALAVIASTTLLQARNPLFITQRLDLIHWLEELQTANTAKVLLPLLEQILPTTSRINKTSCQAQCFQFFQKSPALSWPDIEDELKVMLLYVRLCLSLQLKLNDYWQDIVKRIEQLWQPGYVEISLIFIQKLSQISSILQPEIKQQLTNWKSQKAGLFPQLNAQQNPELLDAVCHLLSSCLNADSTIPYDNRLTHWFIKHADTRAKKQLLSTAFKVSHFLSTPQQKQLWILDCITPYQTESIFQASCIAALEQFLIIQSEIPPPLSHDNQIRLQKAIRLWFKLGVGNQAGIRKWWSELGKAGLSENIFELIWTACLSTNCQNWRKISAPSLVTLLQEVSNCHLNTKIAKEFHDFCTQHDIACPQSILYPHLIQGVPEKKQQLIADQCIQQEENKALLLVTIIKSANFNLFEWMMSRLSIPETAKSTAEILVNYAKKYDVTRLAFECPEDYDKLLTSCYKYLNDEDRQSLFLHLIELVSLQRVISEVNIGLYKAEHIEDTFFNTYLLPLAKEDKTTFQEILAELIQPKQHQGILIHWVIVTAYREGLQLWTAKKQKNKLIKTVVDIIQTSVQADDVGVLLRLLLVAEMSKPYKLQYIQQLICTHLNDCAFADTISDILDSTQAIGGDHEVEKLVKIINNRVDVSYSDHTCSEYRRWRWILSRYSDNHKATQSIMGSLHPISPKNKGADKKNAIQPTTHSLNLKKKKNNSLGPQRMKQGLDNKQTLRHKTVVIQEGIAKYVYRSKKNIEDYLNHNFLTVNDPEFPDYLILMASECEGRHEAHSDRQTYILYALDNFHQYWDNNIPMRFQYANLTLQDKNHWSNNDLKLAIVRLVEIIMASADINNALQTLQALYHCSDVALFHTIILASAAELVSPSITTHPLQKKLLTTNHKLTLMKLTRHINDAYLPKAATHNLHSLDLKYANRLFNVTGKDIPHGQYQLPLEALKLSEKWRGDYAPETTIFANCLKLYIEQAKRPPQHTHRQELKNLRTYLELKNDHIFPEYLAKKIKALLTQLENSHYSQSALSKLSSDLNTSPPPNKRPFK